MNKFCPNCGKELNENANVCPKCGKFVNKNDSQNQNTKKCKHCSSLIDKNAKICPYCKQSQNTRAQVLLIIMFILLGVWFYNSFSSIGDIFKKEEIKKLSCEGLPSTTFEEIYQANSNNEVDARNKYLNKSFNFSGTIDQVNYNEFSDKPYLKIKNEWVIATIYLNKEEYSKVSDYNKGDVISFCGTVDDLFPLIGAMDI